jgi:hypothetical protein
MLIIIISIMVMPDCFRALGFEKFLNDYLSATSYVGGFKIACLWKFGISPKLLLVIIYVERIVYIKNV